MVNGGWFRIIRIVMKIYHSFWEHGWNTFDEKVYNMHKLSAMLALKNYGNITLITTKKGLDLLSGIPYTNIELFEEDVDKTFKDTWSISKMYAYKQIAKKNEPFLHIDYDVFLFKRLPDWFEKSNICYQHIEESKHISYYYKFDTFFEFCKNTYLSDKSLRFAYNLGVFGGNDIESINFYLNEAFKLYFDKENLESFWLKTGLGLYHGTKTTLLEQWYLACCLKKINVIPTPLFENNDKINIDAVDLGYCHVWGAKNINEVHEKIKNKIIEYENI
jgi:hypothetical protein